MVNQCPHCDTKYSGQEINFVSRSKAGAIFHLYCQECDRAMLLKIRKHNGGLECFGIFTDCNFEDSAKFLGGEAISVDDVIGVHLALELDSFI